MPKTRTCELCERVVELSTMRQLVAGELVCGECWDIEKAEDDDFFSDTAKESAMFSLSVYYDMADNEETKEKDAMAEEAAGRKRSGSGCYLPTMTRDIEFKFHTEQEMEAAKAKLLEAGFRLVP